MSVIEHLRNCRCSFHCSKSFWDSTPPEGTLWPVNPKTGQKVVVLGFDPARGISRTHQSQNDLEQELPKGIVPLPAVNLYGKPGVNPYRLNFQGHLYGKQAFFRTDFSGDFCCAGFACGSVGV